MLVRASVDGSGKDLISGVYTIQYSQVTNHLVVKRFCLVRGRNQENNKINRKFVAEPQPKKWHAEPERLLRTSRSHPNIIEAVSHRDLVGRKSGISKYKEREAVRVENAQEEE